MASFLLPAECLDNIFSYLIEHHSNYTCTNSINMPTKDLYSCTLVSRHWCRISTPYLYAYPFHHFHRSYLSHHEKTYYFKLIRTLLNCVPQFEIKQIYTPYYTQNNPSTFNYISFIRYLIVNEEMMFSQNMDFYNIIWLSAHNISSKIAIQIMKHLVIYLCKHSNLTTLEFPFTKQNNDIIEILSNSICNLKSLYSNKDISSIEGANSLSQFIFSQKKLQHISLLGEHCRYGYGEYYNIALNSFSSQSESLQILEFEYLSFGYININSLCLLKNIRKLKLYKCNKIEDNLHVWAKSLTKLEVFEVKLHRLSSISGDFLIQLIQSSSSTLIKLVIIGDKNAETENLDIRFIQQIPRYLGLLIHLELPSIFSTELISIFKSCTKLIYLRVGSLSDETLSKEILESLGKFVPKTLKWIHFGNPSINHDELDYFLQCVNGDCILYLECGCNRHTGRVNDAKKNYVIV